MTYVSRPSLLRHDLLSRPTDIATTRSKIYMWKYDTLVFAVFYVRYKRRRYKSLQVTSLQITSVFKTIVLFNMYVVFLLALQNISGCVPILGLLYDQPLHQWVKKLWSFLVIQDGS